MAMNILASLLFTIITLAFGQILIKKGMLLAGPLPPNTIDVMFFLIKNIVMNPYIVGGLSLSVASTAGWMITLSKTELSFAYPFISLAFPLVLILSYFMLGENIPLIRWIGMAIIFIGLFVVSRSN
jgi:drug/metabolite transporter (DMT)-like permease